MHKAIKSVLDGKNLGGHVAERKVIKNDDDLFVEMTDFTYPTHLKIKKMTEKFKVEIFPGTYLVGQAGDYAGYGNLGWRVLSKEFVERHLKG